MNQNPIIQHLQKEVLTIAICWHLKLKNGKEMGFTNHDVDILHNNIKYSANSGFTPSAISSSTGLSIDNLDIGGIIDNQQINENDILAGLYDHAEIQIFLINYSSPQSEILNLRKGWLGEVKLSKRKFIVEVRGMLQALSNAKIGEFYSSKCRASFGDQHCQVSKSQYQITDLEVTAIEDNKSFYFKRKKQKNHNNDKISETSSLDKKFINCGFLTFHSGANMNLTMEIQHYDKNQISLALTLPYSIKIGDKFSITPGCDKKFHSCYSVYNNAINFRGEPHIPNIQKIKNEMASL